MSQTRTRYAYGGDGGEKASDDASSNESSEIATDGGEAGCGSPSLTETRFTQKGVREKVVTDEEMGLQNTYHSTDIVAV